MYVQHLVQQISISVLNCSSLSLKYKHLKQTIMCRSRKATVALTDPMPRGIVRKVIYIDVNINEGHVR